MNKIYALRCSKTGAIRYIGKSNNPERRFGYHLREAESGRRDHYTARWLRKCIREDAPPSLFVVMTVPKELDWQTMERFVIASAKHFGFRLTNETDGGDAFDGIDRDKWLRKLREANATEECRANKKAAQLLAASDPKNIAARSAGAKRRYLNPEERAKESAACSKRWADPEFRAKTEASIRASRTPEVMKKIGDANKRYWADPVNKAKRVATQNDPVVQAKRSAALKLHWADHDRRVKHVARINDPLIKAKTIAARNDPVVEAQRIAAYKKTIAARQATRPEADLTKWARHNGVMETDVGVRRKFEAFREAQRARTLANPSRAKSPEAKARQLAGLTKYNESQRAEKLRRTMEWDTA